MAPRRKKTEAAETAEAAAAPAQPVGDPYENLEIQAMLRDNHEKYFLCNLVSRRAIDLKKGARALVDIKGPHTNIELALAEAREGLLKIRKRRVQTRMVNLAEGE